MRHVRTLQINLSRAPGRGDLEHRQFAAPVEKGYAARGSGYGSLHRLVKGPNMPAIFIPFFGKLRHEKIFIPIQRGDR